MYDKIFLNMFYEAYTMGFTDEFIKMTKNVFQNQENEGNNCFHILFEYLRRRINHFSFAEFYRIFTFLEERKVSLTQKNNKGERAVDRLDSYDSSYFPELYPELHEKNGEILRFILKKLIEKDISVNFLYSRRLPAIEKEIRNIGD